MIIVLPDEKDGLENIENNFPKINLNNILNKMNGYHVHVKLPRFKLEQSLRTEGILSNVRIHLSTQIDTSKKKKMYNVQ